MESAMCVSGFLLLVFITGVQCLSPHPKLIFGHEGGEAIFYSNSVDYYEEDGEDDNVLYRVCGGEDLLLVNCSHPDRPGSGGYEVKCDDSTSFYFRMVNLTMSHSGHHRAESWTGGNITEHASYRLIVCAQGGESSVQRVYFDDRVELCSRDSAKGNGSSLQLYRRTLADYVLVLDTNSSLEPLMEDLTGRLQVDLNTSLVTLSGITGHDPYFYCTAWRGAQCQSYSKRDLSISRKYVFAYEDENVTLSCIAKGELPDQVYWTSLTEFGYYTIKQNHPQEGMFMLNNSQTGDYSLVIPSVLLEESGEYICEGSSTLKQIDLFVCTKYFPLEVMFSPGKSVFFNITEYMYTFDVLYGTQWYHQRVLQPQVQIADFYSYYGPAAVSLTDDLRGRVIVSTSPTNSALIMSNLTAKDSGLYTWRAFGQGQDGSGPFLCSEGAFHLVYMDPYGVHSPFYRAYAPLIGCGLLGLAAAVIWFKLRSRRGEQTSGVQNRVGQLSGDEDLYDDVEKAELNATPSAVSAVIPKEILFFLSFYNIA